MKKKIILVLLTISLFCHLVWGETNRSVVNDGNGSADQMAVQNMCRAIQIADSAILHHFTSNGMARYYYPRTDTRSGEKASVWMYTSSIEAVNAILRGLKAHKEHGNAGLYEAHFGRYAGLLDTLYANLAWYRGTFTLTSYTQTKEWSVYGVDRGRAKGTARVEGIYNVYDDQQWLIREMLESYKITGNDRYLEEAEYLASYVLDGWDGTLDSNGKEHGGITWGPGYVTKHSCSNGPMVSPLVWLYELYKGDQATITYLYIDTDGRRKTRQLRKDEYYLQFAEAVYQWQKNHLLRDDGVYHDMMGGCDPNCHVAYETIDGIKYRRHNHLRHAGGKAYTYNCGTMLSGAADLYRATGESVYLDDAKKLSGASFSYFAKMGTTIPGHYTYPIGGFSNWFNGVLMRGYVDVYPSYRDIGKCIDSFQQNLDHGYQFLYRGTLPSDLLQGWNVDEEKNKTEGMFSFTFAAEYAILAQYQLEKGSCL
ncbi:MAG: glycoside hydrolase family 76 protein [Bacteroidales bacterium]|jgi:hypothetical protein|nr:glycoside hydrolase family 76 protein [Bacteroidales bacterium]